MPSAATSARSQSINRTGSTAQSLPEHIQRNRRAQKAFTVCDSLGIECKKHLGTGALSMAFEGPPVVVKAAELKTNLDMMFWKNKSGFFEFMQKTRLPVLSKYFLVPFTWYTDGNMAVTVEAKTDGYTTLRSFFDDIPKPWSPRKLTQVRRVLEAIVNAITHINGAGVSHCDTHMDNIMIKTSSSNDEPKIKLIDYDWTIYPGADATVLSKIMALSGSQDISNGLRAYVGHIIQHVPNTGSQGPNPCLDLYLLLNSLRIYQNSNKVPELQEFINKLSVYYQGHCMTTA